MLRVLDPKAAIAFAVYALGVFVVIEDRRIGPVAYGVDIHLETLFVSIDDVLLHRRSYFGPRKTCRIRCIEIRLEKPRGGRTKAPVRKSFETADAKHRRAECVMHSCILPALVIAQRRTSVNARL